MAIDLSSGTDRFYLIDRGALSKTEGAFDREIPP
ncbi:hypothetical protein GGQ63_003820 [Prosthecomicrobium pneumaticum]|uniref:Uncharacterized protein n=1 Tax=Prosthecomicrobium pneumaticum TaxID=81895 RepID=A0A7W9FQ38_9HYPH|nr:hypothetical protein [Prosthecomicrobium pneumaticum]